MSQNKKLTFHEYSKPMLEELKNAALAEKHELEELKKASGKDWEPASQKELDALDAKLAAINEAIALKAEAPKDYVPTKGTEAIALKAEAPKDYVPTKGTEKMVHLSIVKGRRFNPMTGKEESIPYTQLFTFPEWQLFKRHFRSLGYSIMTVLHDPYGEAAELVTKSK